MGTHTFTLRAFPIKPEFGGGFGARIYDVERKESILAPSKFTTYEAARDWTKIEAHRLMGPRVYRVASIKASRRDQNRFYTANIWAY